MNQRKEAQTRLWIRDRDSLGNTVDHRLIEAAHRVWERARLVVIRYLAEDTEAPEILEAAVDSASRAMDNPQSIQFFEAYLLKSVTRESIRRRRRNQRVEYVDNAISNDLLARYPRTWNANSTTPSGSNFFALVWMSTDGQCTICAFWISIGGGSPSSRDTRMPTAPRPSSVRSLIKPWNDSGLTTIHV